MLENIRKKFQFDKEKLVDEVLEFDKQFREAKVSADNMRKKRNDVSKQIGRLMGQGLKDEAEKVCEIVKREMSSAIDFGVPLDVSIGVGPNWLDAH